MIMQSSSDTPGEGRASPRRSGMRGFTMVEAMMAAAMLGIVVVGTMQFFSYGQSRMTSLAVDRAAYDVARNEIEKIIARGYGSATSQTDTTQTLFGEPMTITTVVSYVDDPVDSLSTSDPDGPEDYKNVVVTVTYQDTKTATLQALITPE
jgi:type II secretory pathway pseudopilin PulG